ncbi:MAG: NADH:flavin oxidoreductase [Negativicutes bacterium]|nr:NADH:flavin oxidoreductase [Negativicutes bacterium]
MTKITDDLVIRGNRIRNRIVMAPMVTFSFHGDNGSHYGRQHVEHYTQRAKGGAGLIIVQATRVIGAAGSTHMWSMDNVAALKQIAGNCHAHGATIMMQLSCGDMDINQLSTAEVHAMQANMRQAGISACEMGFDGAEYHFAHGFALCKFLDASFNRRTDGYGGDAAGRTKILTELLPDIRSNTHEKFMIGVRMGEYQPSSRDGIEAAKIFEKAGIDLLHISYGMKPPDHAVPAGFPCSPMTYSGCKMKKEVNIPVIAVNEIRTEEQVRFLIENDWVDLVGIGRGMFADPEFANHVLKGEPVNRCLGCGGNVEKCRWFTDHTLCPAGRQR